MGRKKSYVSRKARELFSPSTQRKDRLIYNQIYPKSDPILLFPRATKYQVYLVERLIYFSCKIGGVVILMMFAYIRLSLPGRYTMSCPPVPHRSPLLRESVKPSGENPAGSREKVGSPLGTESQRRPTLGAHPDGICSLPTSPSSLFSCLLARGPTTGVGG